jgi:hypothetical protein
MVRFLFVAQIFAAFFITLRQLTNFIPAYLFQFSVVVFLVSAFLIAIILYRKRDLPYAQIGSVVLLFYLVYRVFQVMHLPGALYLSLSIWPLLAFFSYTLIRWRSYQNVLPVLSIIFIDLAFQVISFVIFLF